MLKTMNYYNYFTEIEEHFVRRRGKHLLISPMDWALIASWRDAGIPLQVALRGVDIAMDGFLARQHSSGSKVNSLCYCHDAVMTEYAAHLESHVGDSSSGGQGASESPQTGSDKKEEPGAAEILEFLSARISEIKALSTKQYPGGMSEGIHRVLSRLEEVYGNLESSGRVDSLSLERDLGIIDELLMAELQAAVPPEQMLAWEKEAKKDLKVYRKRLPKETYAKIRDNFMHDKVRREFSVGEMSLFRL
jgi:hypothetical protein